MKWVRNIVIVLVVLVVAAVVIIKLWPMEDSLQSAQILRSEALEDMDMRKLFQAEAMLERLAQAEPNNDEVFMELARTRNERRRYNVGIDDTEENELKQSIIKAGRRAVEINPKNSFAWAELGFVYAADPRNRPKCIDAFNKVIELEPDRAFGTVELGVCYFKNKQYDEAEQTLNKALAMKPTPGDTDRVKSFLRRIASIRAGQGDPEAADAN